MNDTQCVLRILAVNVSSRTQYARNTLTRTHTAQMSKIIFFNQWRTADARHTFHKQLDAIKFIVSPISLWNFRMESSALATFCSAGGFFWWNFRRMGASQWEHSSNLIGNERIESNHDWNSNDCANREDMGLNFTYYYQNSQNRRYAFGHKFCIFGIFRLNHRMLLIQKTNRKNSNLEKKSVDNISMRLWPLKRHNNWK